MAERLSELTRRAQEMDRAFDCLRAIQIRAKHWNNGNAALAEAEQEFGSGSQIYWAVKAAVTGDTTSSASELVGDRAVRAWASILSGKTIAGQVPFQKAPFRTDVPTESTPGSANWVGEGEPIPVSKFSLTSTALDKHKISGIVPMTDELLQLARPETLQFLNMALLKVIARYQDQAMLDPDVAAVSLKNPQSLTNGISPIESTGSTEATITANLKTMLQSHTSAGADLNDVYICMHPVTALHMSTLLTAGNIRAFPNLGVRGGEIFGVPVLTSVGAIASGSPSERIIAALNAQGIFVADEGEVQFAASKQAAIQLDNAPTNSVADGTATTVVSLLQTGSTAIRFSRYISFQRAFDGAVSYMRVTY
jgi:hypothetical protein